MRVSMDPFRKLTEEELKDFVPLSDEEITALLEEGWKEAQALLNRVARDVQGRFV